MLVARKLLIIEDEVPMLQALVKKFTSEGFECYSAEDGEAGLASGLKNKPDLVMMDVIMPKMNGLEVARKFREDKRWGSLVPIIMLTNLSDAETVAEAARYKVYDFLVKTDWRLDDIVTLVNEKINNNGN